MGFRIYDTVYLGKAHPSGGGGGYSPICFREFDVDATMELIPSKTTSRIININGANNIADYALYCAYYENTNISGDVNFSSLKKLSHMNSCYYTFYRCTGITNADMQNIIEIAGQNACNGMFRESGITGYDLTSLNKISGSQACAHMFESTPNLTKAFLDNVTTISGVSACNRMFADSAITFFSMANLQQISSSNACVEMCAGCKFLVVVNLPALHTISVGSSCKHWFTKCISLETVTFTLLKNIGVGKIFESAFANDTALTDLYFPALYSGSFGTYQDQFTNMLDGCNNVTVHFPSNLQTIISTWADYTAGFGSATTTVAFDLPATS